MRRVGRFQVEQRQRIGLGSLTRREFTCALALGVGSAAPRFASTTPQLLQPSSINIGGDLGRRAALSFNRLESDIYSPPQVFNSRSIKSWPGDWEGRTILGLTLLEQYTKRPARHLPQILREMRNHLNSLAMDGSSAASPNGMSRPSRTKLQIH